jgi:hypothetical protein
LTPACWALGADRIFINVGGRASIPPIPGLDQIPYFTNSLWPAATRRRASAGPDCPVPMTIAS